MIVGIHQPDFLPWLGFFNKYRKSDVFVILDHTENNPRDANFWCRRVTILANKQPLWLSVPLMKAEGRIGIPINEMRLNLNDRKFQKRSLSTLQQNYTKAPFYKDVFPLIEAYFTHESENLQQRNMDFILTVGERLDFQAKIVFSSSLDCVNQSTELLVEIIQKIGGSTYLSGQGADGYMKKELFDLNDISLQFNDFYPMPYAQFNVDEFVPGLSIIDALMNLGFDGVKNYYQLLDAN